MTQEINTQLADKTFYTSPTKKIHSTECRHYRSDKPGWQKIDSIFTAIDEGYQLCRICCPSQDEINALRQQATSSLPPSSMDTSLASVTEEIASDSKLVTETSETQSGAENLPTPTDSPDSSADKIVAAETTNQKVEGDNQISEITAETKSDSTSKQKSSPSEEKQTTEVSQNESEEAISKTEAKSDENKQEEKTEAKSDENKQEEKTEAKSKKKKKKKKTQQKSESDTEKAENKGETKSDSKSDQKQKKDKDKSDSPKEPKKRYKVLPGNGCHQAIAEVQGILVPPTEKKGKFILILSDGVQLEAIFKNPRLKWIACNKDWIIGAHWFRGYPKMKDDKLVAFQIIGWDGNMPTNQRGWEVWEFTGYWTIQKTLTVQRSMMIEEIRQLAKETGFIKKFKYTFTNSFDWVKSKKLWAGYVYKLICRREGDLLKIQKVIPYACPRIKPLPPGRKPMDGKGKFKPKDGKERDKNKNSYKDKSSEGKQSSTEPKTEQTT